MAARVKDYDEPYDGQGHGLGVTLSDSEVDDDDWTGRYALGDSTGPTNAWSGVKPVFTNVCDVTVWVEAVLEGWSGTTSGVVRIRPAALAITAKDQTCDFDGRPHGEDRATYTDPAEIAARVEVSGLVPGDGLASVTLDGTRTAPGTEPIIPSGVVVTNATGDVTFNYAVGYTNGTLTILAPQPEVTDVVAAPTGGAWQGQVDISFNVTNDVARGLPEWNRPVLSIVATDHLTGSNYVADVSALSARAPYQLADALAGSNGTHAVTWDFTAQGIDFSSTNVTFTVAYLRMPDYCVIDLSDGTAALSLEPFQSVSRVSPYVLLRKLCPDPAQEKNQLPLVFRFERISAEKAESLNVIRGKGFQNPVCGFLCIPFPEGEVPGFFIEASGTVVSASGDKQRHPAAGPVGNIEVLDISVIHSSSMPAGFSCRHRSSACFQSSAFSSYRS